MATHIHFLLHFLCKNSFSCFYHKNLMRRGALVSPSACWGWSVWLFEFFVQLSHYFFVNSKICQARQTNDHADNADPPPMLNVGNRWKIWDHNSKIGPCSGTQVSLACATTWPDF